MPTTTMPENRIYSHVETPIGPVLLAGRPRVLSGLFVAGHHRCPPVPSAWRRDDDSLGEARRQLEEYFAGTRTAFDLPLELEGTPFQVAVWSALSGIPYGETISYGELARRVGRPGASRAVGAANGRNPISIVVPCHRVIGADGTLTGYGWGNERKAWLLGHERAGRLL
ncbi:MAG TPA: methylated-DNA--[protein]-cysteine S-methyltransferase [Acidimicrobiia bacterium]|nr:methylated-DNA--[protein]-cysteine S-methyltransferase [Acidimicrobiia bacterium]